MLERFYKCNLFPFNFYGGALNTPGIRKIDFISLYFSVVSSKRRHLSVHKFLNMNHRHSVYLSLCYSIHVPGVPVSIFLILLSTLLVYKNGNAWIWIMLDHVCWHQESKAAGKLVMCACLSISSNCTHKNISGAQAGKENLALAQCRASLKKIIVPETRKLQRVLI